MTITEAIREHVRKTFDNRCAYCLSAQQHILFPLEIDHIIPSAKGGSDNEDNLCLSCRSCNSHKATQTHAIDPETKQRVSLFNPRMDTWSDHFRWSADGTLVVGLSPRGRATVVALQMNNEFIVTPRRLWVSVGWHPPT
jgi:5-methylcytosine-specific restriction endonuclease McrA